MKNTYFNDVLNFTVELGVIQKKKKHKNTLLKTLQKGEKKILKKIHLQIPVDCVERKEAWFPALILERQKKRADQIE